MKSPSFSIALFFLLVFLVSSTTAGDFRVVALSDQLAPGTTNGEIFDSFGSPDINNLGQVAFKGAMEVGAGGVVDNDSRYGIWEEDNGNLRLVVRGGDQIPGLPAEVGFGRFLSNPSINDNGDVLFVGDFVDPVVHDGLWRETNGALELIARTSREGGPEQSVPAGQFFYSLGWHIGSLQHNNLGQTVFIGGGEPDPGVWSEANGTLQNIASRGSQVPDMEAGVIFGDLEYAEINELSQTLIKGTFSIDGVSGEGKDALWIADADGTFRLVASRGAQAPGVLEGTEFLYINSLDYWERFFHNRGLNDIGQVAFSASFQSEDGSYGAGVWSEGSGALNLVAQSGEVAPGTDGAVFDDDRRSYSTMIDNNGHVLFSARLETGVGGVTLDDDKGIWVENSDGLYLLARKGSPAPGMPIGTTLIELGPRSLMKTGQAIFSSYHARRESGAIDYTKVGIWAEDSNDNLQLIIKPGDVIDIAPGDSRVVSGVSSNYAFNDLGQIVITAGFTDGSLALLVSNKVAIPEPATCIQVALAAMLLFMRRQSSGTA